MGDYAVFRLRGQRGNVLHVVTEYDHEKNVELFPDVDCELQY